MAIISHLQARPLVLLQVRLDLRLAGRAKGGLVDGKNDKLVVTGQHGGVEPGIKRAHILWQSISCLLRMVTNESEPISLI